MDLRLPIILFSPAVFVYVRVCSSAVFRRIPTFLVSALFYLQEESFASRGKLSRDEPSRTPIQVSRPEARARVVLDSFFRADSTLTHMTIQVTNSDSTQIPNLLT